MPRCPQNSRRTDRKPRKTRLKQLSLATTRVRPHKKCCDVTTIDPLLLHLALLVAAPDGGSKDVFVHISAVERSGLTGLADNQKVTFDIEPGRDGREAAVNIALA